MRVLALALLLSACAGALISCGGSKATPAELRLEREDLVAVARALKSVEPQATREVEATKRAWPLVANGLPAGSPRSLRGPVTAASESADRIKAPALLGKDQTNSLTGQAAAISGLFRTYRGLVTRGWQLTGATVDEIEAAEHAGSRASGPTTGPTTSTTTGPTTGTTTSGGSSTANAALTLEGEKFARENVGLYIESVYDGHFDLAQIGKRLEKGYHNLGGEAVFGSSLTSAEVTVLADAYSEAATRLHPHVGVRLGS